MAVHLFLSSFLSHFRFIALSLPLLDASDSSPFDFVVFDAAAAAASELVDVGNAMFVGQCVPCGMLQGRP